MVAGEAPRSVGEGYAPLWPRRGALQFRPLLIQPFGGANQCPLVGNERRCQDRAAISLVDPRRTFVGAKRLAHDINYRAAKSFASFRTKLMNCLTTADWSPRREASLSVAFGRMGPLIAR